MSYLPYYKNLLLFTASDTKLLDTKLVFRVFSITQSKQWIFYAQLRPFVWCFRSRIVLILIHCGLVIQYGGIYLETDFY